MPNATDTSQHQTRNPATRTHASGSPNPWPKVPAAALTTASKPEDGAQKHGLKSEDCGKEDLSPDGIDARFKLPLGLALHEVLTRVCGYCPLNPRQAFGPVWHLTTVIQELDSDTPDAESPK